MTQLLNLVVDLSSIQTGAETAPSGVHVSPPQKCDERTLAWIDEIFGGVWSSEAFAGDTIVASRDGELIGFATIDARGLRYAWLGGLAQERDVGLFGPFGIVPNERGTGIGKAVLNRALIALRERGYARALIAAITDERLQQYYHDAVGARVVERFERAALLRPNRRALVMASGNGSNFQAVVDAQKSGSLPLEIIGLLSNNPRAYAIERAHAFDVQARVVAWNRKEESRADYDARLLEAAKSQKPDLVVMLGWMHLLPESFVADFPTLFNLHPAFLPLDPQRDDVVMPDGTRIPAFRGPRAVRDALALGSTWVGATLHRVTTDTDRGPVMARKPLPVQPKENEEDLMERVHGIERGVVHTGITRWLYER